MNVVDAAMNFGNAVNLVAVLFLMRTVIKDKNALKGFSVSGTFLTFIAIIGFEVGFFLMENYVSFALGLITLVFWFMVFVFSLRTLLHERKMPRHEGK
jgi:hypothetical protein